MDNKSFYGRDAPFMIRRQDTGDCVVLLLNLDSRSTNLTTYRSLVSSIEDFSLSIRHRCAAGQGKLINKLEARWLPRRSESEGYPHTLLLNDANAHAILKLILLGQGTDSIKVSRDG